MLDFRTGTLKKRPTPFYKYATFSQSEIKQIVKIPQIKISTTKNNLNCSLHISVNTRTPIKVNQRVACGGVYFEFYGKYNFIYSTKLGYQETYAS